MTFLHSRRAAYYGLLVAGLATCIVFGWRIEETWAILFANLEFWYLIGLRVFIGVTFAILGFVLSTHQRYGLEAVLKRIHDRDLPGMRDEKDKKKATASAKRYVKWAVAFVLLNDFAAALYLVLTEVRQEWYMDALAMIVLAGIIGLPYLLGHWTLALAESVPAEQEELFLAHTQKKLINFQKTRLTRYIDLKLKELESAPLDDGIIIETKALLAAAGDGPYARALTRLMESAAAVSAASLPEPVQEVKRPHLVEPQTEVQGGSGNLPTWTTLGEAQDMLHLSQEDLEFYLREGHIPVTQDDYGQQVLSLLSMARLRQVVDWARKHQALEAEPEVQVISPLSLPVRGNGTPRAGKNGRGPVTVEADPGNPDGNGPKTR